MKRLPLLEAVALVVGSVVGAGFLGIPYVVAKIGFPLGLLLIFGLGLLILVQFMGVTEMILRTSGKHQIVGYVGRYLGPGWKKVIFVLVVLESYGVLLAYIVGEGQVLSALLGGSPLAFGFAFFAFAATVVYFGLRLVEKVDLLLTLLMAAVVVALAFFSWSAIRFENFLSVNPADWLPAYSVILFAFLGVAAVPAARIVLVGQERLLARAVAVAALISIAIYSLFTLAVLGVTGNATTPIATIGLGQALGRGVAIIGNFLAAVTMTTSFLGAALALKETFSFDMKFRRTESWLLVVTVPLILFSFGLHNFIKIVGFVGAVFGGLLGIVLVLAMWQAEKAGDRQPEFVLPYKKFFGWLLILVFALGVVYTLRTL